MKKIFIGVGVVILLALAGRVGWAYYQVTIERNAVAQIPVGHDIAPIDDSDLRLEKVVVADSENAYFDLIKIDKVIYYPEEKKQVIADMVAGKTWDAQLAQELISKNAEAFGYFATASLNPKFQDPPFADPVNITPDAIILTLNITRNMAILSAVKSLSFAKQGKDKEAIEEAMRSVNIGQKIQNSQGTLIHYLVGSAMKGIGLRATQKILETSKLKTSELKKYSQELDKYYKNEEGLILALKADHYIIFSALEMVHSGLAEGYKESKGILNQVLTPEDADVVEKLSNLYSFEINKTKLLHADLFRSQIDDLRRPCLAMHGFAKREPDISSLVESLNFDELKKVENAIGIIFRDVTAKSIGGITTKRCQEDALVGTTQTMFALKAFKNDTKKYPATLDELVPKYLDVIPTDPFDGKPLKYSAEKKIVYSVGEDKRDDGGIMSDDVKKTPDIVYPLGF